MTTAPGWWVPLRCTHPTRYAVAGRPRRNPSCHCRARLPSPPFAKGDRGGFHRAGALSPAVVRRVAEHPPMAKGKGTWLVGSASLHPPYALTSSDRRLPSPPFAKGDRGGFHRAGALSPAVVRRVAEHPRMANDNGTWLVGSASLHPPYAPRARRLASPPFAKGDRGGFHRAGALSPTAPCARMSLLRKQEPRASGFPPSRE